MSMDVTFRESEPFYGEKTDLSMLFEKLDHLRPTGIGQEGEKMGTSTTESIHSNQIDSVDESVQGKGTDDGQM